MPFYTELRRKRKQPWARRTAANLVRIRAALRKGPHKIPEKVVDKRLLIGTWNIRDFDGNKFKYGPREREAYFYIAEVLSSFDIVAVQEVNRDLKPLKRVMQILGPDWDFMVSDVTEGRGGNGERMAYVWDKRKVRFRGVVGEVVLPGKETQFSRTPFMAAFQSGWFKFNLCAVHIYYGANYGEKLERRKKEIKKIAEFFARRSKKEKESNILLGDFNIKHPEHGTMKALEAGGYYVPPGLQRKTTLTDNYYDQIAFLKNDPQLDLGSLYAKAGATQLFELAYRDQDFTDYKGIVKAGNEYQGDAAAFVADLAAYRKWRTWQLSDHYPLWVQLRIDFSDEYLATVGS